MMSAKKSPKKVCSVALPPEMIEYVKDFADRRDRSMSQVIQLMVNYCIVDWGLDGPYDASEVENKRVFPKIDKPSGYKG